MVPADAWLVDACTAHATWSIVERAQDRNSPHASSPQDASNPARSRSSGGAGGCAFAVDQCVHRRRDAEFRGAVLRRPVGSSSRRQAARARPCAQGGNVAATPEQSATRSALRREARLNSQALGIPRGSTRPRTQSSRESPQRGAAQTRLAQRGGRNTPRRSRLAQVRRCALRTVRHATRTSPVCSRSPVAAPDVD